MKAFVVAAFVCAVAHLTQGGELPQKITEKRNIISGVFGGVADIHASGIALGGGGLHGGLVGVGSGLVGTGYTPYNSEIVGSARPWAGNYGGGYYGYRNTANNYYSGANVGSGGPWANKYGNVESGYYGNVGSGYYGNGGYGSAYSGPGSYGYGIGGVSHIERYDGHGAGYSNYGIKLANGASTYSRLSYGGSKYY